MAYDPRSAVKALLADAKQNQPKIVSSNVPGLVKSSGEAYQVTKPPIEGLCITVASIEDGSAQLPPDFADVPMTRDGLKAHVRPDGGVCLGFFGMTPTDAVIVYGDPGMSREQAKRIVLSFWQQAKLGPFGGPKLEVVS
jgi:hypothetical protein